MAETVVSVPLSSRRQWQLVAGLLVVILVLLAAAYFWFLSSDYVVLTQGARPEQAAAIVDELKKEGVAYKLGDGGSTILVPASKFDAARLDIASKSLPLKGTVGFEIFDQSDMGLTDFAQKVNYQRALQGELERTIMAMDGIAYARVHIAIPEHSLFRDAQSQPRAAVTLTPQPGATLGADRIAGIQRLVAAAVPELALDQVAILNERGELLTPSFTDVGSAGTSESALEANYEQRAAQAIATAAPQAQVTVKVTTLPRQLAEGTQSTGAPQAGAPPRDHSIRVVVFSSAPLSDADQQSIRRAVTTELSLDPASGDALQFSPVPVAAPSLPMPTQPLASAGTHAPVAADESGLMAELERNWTIALLVLAVIAGSLAWLGYRKSRDRYLLLLVERVRTQLFASQADANA